jgi:hypothetical protein
MTDDISIDRSGPELSACDCDTPLLVNDIDLGVLPSLRTGLAEGDPEPDRGEAGEHRPDRRPDGRPRAREPAAAGAGPAAGTRWRCGADISAGTPASRWDLGHVDPEYQRFYGARHPEHSGCNRATVTHLKNEMERLRREGGGCG